VITFMVKKEELLEHVKDAIKGFVANHKETIKSFGMIISSAHRNHK